MEQREGSLNWKYDHTTIYNATKPYYFNKHENITARKTAQKQ